MVISLTKGHEICVMEKDLLDIYSVGKEKLILLGNCLDAQYNKYSADKVYHLVKKDSFRVADCHGIFSVIYYDGIDSLIFYNDRMNVSKLYYYFDSNKILISNKVSSIVEYVDKKLTIDFNAWAEFFCFYYVMGNRTFFQEIKSLYFGEKIKLKIHQWHLESVIDNTLSEIKIDNNLEYDDAVATSAKMIIDSVKDIFRHTKDKKKSVTLSGGWDSRVIAACGAMIDKEKVDSFTTYIDSGYDREERFAKQVADYLKIPNQFFDLDSDYYLKELDAYVKEIDFFSTMHIPFWNFYSKFSDNTGIFLDGLLGDLFFRGMALPNTNKVAGSEEYFEDCFKCLKRGQPERFMSVMMKKGISMMAKNGMVEEIKRCKYNLRLFVIANRSRNIGFTVYKINKKATVLMPFCERRLLEFAMKIPVEYICNPKFYPDIMRKIDEGLVRIPSTNDKIESQSFQARNIYKISKEVELFYKKTFAIIIRR